MSILLITVCALAAGKNGYTAIETWAKDAPATVLTALDVRFDPFTARHVCPDESTIRDALARVNADDLAAAGCAFLADLVAGRTRVRHDVPDEREARRARAAAAGTRRGAARAKAYAGDGKRPACARRPDGSHVHPLSLVDHASGTTIAQREIAAKSHEILEARALLADADVAGAVLSLDASHTQRATAEAIVTDHHAAYLFTIKANQPNPRAAVAARLTKPNSHFQDAGQYVSHTNTGHGRVERRDIRVADADGIDFPHAAQIFQIIRRGKKPGSPAWDRKEVVFGITAPTATQAGPADLAQHTRGHWSIENKSHYERPAIGVTWWEGAEGWETGTG